MLLLKLLVLFSSLNIVSSLVEGDKASVALYSSFGLRGEWRERVVVTLSLVPTPSGLNWKPLSTTSDLVVEEDLHQARKSLDAGDYYRIRARHSSGDWVVGSVRMVGVLLFLLAFFFLIRHLACPPKFLPPPLPHHLTLLLSAPWQPQTGLTM